MALTLAIAGSVPRIQWLISPHRWLYPFAIFKYTYLFNTYAVIPSAILISFEAVPIGYSALINALFPRTGPACNSAIPSLHTYPARPQNKRTANVSTSTFAVLYCVLPYAAFHLIFNKSLRVRKA